MKTASLCVILTYLLPLFQATTVLVLYSVPVPLYVNDVTKKLSSVGFSVNTFNGATSTPTAAVLSSYNAVFAFSDSGWADPITLGNNMAYYVDHGGAVILAMFDFVANSPNEPIKGKFTDYMAIQPANEKPLGLQSLVPLSNHPILNGVKKFNGGSSSYRSGSWHSLTTQVAQWTDGTPLIGVRVVNGSRRVDLSFYPPSSDARADFWNSTTDGLLIMSNAINWATGSNQCSSNFDCLGCTTVGCQWCLDTNVCSQKNITCEDRVTVPKNCPLVCSSFSSCSTCVDSRNNGACTWCLNSFSCIPHRNEFSCSDAINNPTFCNRPF